MNARWFVIVLVPLAVVTLGGLSLLRLQPYIEQPTRTATAWHAPALASATPTSTRTPGWWDTALPLTLTPQP